jgi:hypothetical protein
MKDNLDRDADLPRRDAARGNDPAHPVGTGAGALGGAAAGAAAGSVVGGPVGAVVGGVVGAVAGGAAGHEIAEEVNPTVEDAYWRDNFRNRPYATADRGYDYYRPGYQYGWESYGRYRGRKYDDVESDLERGWDKFRGESRLTWNEAKGATRDAWHRVERAIPGDADRDGR